MNYYPKHLYRCNNADFHGIFLIKIIPDKYFCQGIIFFTLAIGFWLLLRSHPFDVSSSALLRYDSDSMSMSGVL